MFKNKVDTYLRRAGYTQMKNVGLSISQRLPCPPAIWVFPFDGNIVKFCEILLNRVTSFRYETKAGLTIQITLLYGDIFHFNNNP